MKQFIALLTLVSLIGGCADATSPRGVVRYQPAIVPVVDERRFPFPSDAYRMDGKLQFVAAKDAVPALSMLLLPALQTTGFGTQESVYFGIEGPLPEQPWPITSSGAFAGLVALPDDGSSNTVPAEILMDKGRNLVSVTPALGFPLRGGQKYIAYLLDRNGLSADKPFVRIRDGHPKDTNEQRLATLLDTPLDRAAKALNVRRKEIVGATLFTPADPAADLRLIRNRILTGRPPKPSFDPQWHYGNGGRPLRDLFGTPTADFVGGDNPGGVLHKHVAEVFVGSLPMRQWIDAPERLAFRYDTAGKPLERTPADISFVLALPDCPRPAGGYPVTIVQHGLTSDKSFVLVLAEMLNKRCIASVGIDAVNHGANAFGAHDRQHNLTGKPGADGLGDQVRYAGLDQIFLLKPLVARDNLRQSALNLLQLYQSLAETAWQPGSATSPVLDGSNIMYVGESMGSIVGAVFVALAPALRAAALAVGGGNFLRLATEGPGFRDFLPAMALLTDEDPTRPLRRDNPVLALLQGILDGADPINYARFWLRDPLPGSRPRSVLIPTAERDQLVPASSSEGLAIAAGLGFVSGYINWRKNYDIVPLAAPLQGNITTPQGKFTGGILVFPGANHGLIQYRCAMIEHQPYYPWSRLGTPYRIANPTARVQEIVGDFLAGSLDGGVPKIQAVGATGSARIDPKNCK